MRASTQPASANEFLFVGDSFEGTFLQLREEHRTWTASQWRDEFQNLRRLDIKILIVQWLQHDVSDFTAGPPGKSCLEQLVTAADEAGMSLYVGLSLRKSWWQADSFTPGYMAEELERNARLADRCLSLLNGHRSFRGWYIPHEVSDIDNDGERQAAVLNFFRQLTARLNELTPLKPVLASGYTDRDRVNMVHFVSWWTLFLREGGVDIVLFQDGAGLARETPWPTVLPFVEAITSIADELRAEVWLVGEVFAQVHGHPIDDQPFQAIPAAFDDVQSQLQALGRYKRRLIAYSYFDYMRPAANPQAARLFEAMKQLVESKAAAATSLPASAPATVTAPAGSQP